MTRLAPLVFLVLAAGCGPLRTVLTPSLASVPRLAPDLVPEQSAAAAVVTARAPGRGVAGRVFDRDTGGSLAGILLDVTDAVGQTTAVETDARGAFGVAGASGLALISAQRHCGPDLAARLAVGADSSAAVIVLLGPVLSCGHISLVGPAGGTGAAARG